MYSIILYFSSIYVSYVCFTIWTFYLEQKNCLKTFRLLLCRFSLRASLPFALKFIFGFIFFCLKIVTFYDLSCDKKSWAISQYFNLELRMRHPLLYQSRYLGYNAVMRLRTDTLSIWWHWIFINSMAKRLIMKHIFID